jgi:hypothetical protein
MTCLKKKMHPCWTVILCVLLLLLLLTPYLRRRRIHVRHFNNLGNKSSKVNPKQKLYIPKPQTKAIY